MRMGRFCNVEVDTKKGVLTKGNMKTLNQKMWGHYNLTLILYRLYDNFFGFCYTYNIPRESINARLKLTSAPRFSSGAVSWTNLHCHSQLSS